MPSSKVKITTANVLKDEGYIEDFAVSTEGGGKAELKISFGSSSLAIQVIERLERIGH